LDRTSCGVVVVNVVPLCSVQLHERSQEVQKLTCDVELLERKCLEDEREASSLRAELRPVASTAADMSSATDELQRVKDEVKQLEQQRNAAQQHCDTAETKLKDLEGYHT